MRLITPEILWHGEKLPERVYSVDFQYQSMRLATGGADPDVHVRSGAVILIYFVHTATVC